MATYAADTNGNIREDDGNYLYLVEAQLRPKWPKSQQDCQQGGYYDAGYYLAQPAAVFRLVHEEAQEDAEHREPTQHQRVRESADVADLAGVFIASEQSSPLVGDRACRHVLFLSSKLSPLDYISERRRLPGA